jgi:hypothetical protein
LNDEFKEITGSPTQLDRESSMERAFTVLKLMRGIVRNTNYTKTVRRKWQTEINLKEAKLLQLKQLALERQPMQIHELLNQLEGLITDAKDGNASPQAVRSHVSKTNSFLVHTYPSVHKTNAQQALNETARGFRLWLQQHKKSRVVD